MLLKEKFTSTAWLPFQKYSIRSINQKEVGLSTLVGRKIWFDDAIGKLNHDERGKYLGSFNTNDYILIIKKDQF